MSYGPLTAMLALLLSPVALAGVAEGPAAGPACPSLPDHPDLACVSGPGGWFYASDADAAAQIQADVMQAGRDFAHHFGRPAMPGAVIAAGSMGTFNAPNLDLLEEAGARWILPWLDERERRTIQRSLIEGGLREQMPDAADEVIAALLEQAVPATSTGAGDSTRSALRHEVGHMLLIHAFWPGDTPAEGDQQDIRYGGPGPDWLDEAAAVLLEGPAMATRRMELLATDKASGRLLPLRAFFATPHPMLETISAARAANAGSDGASITFSSGDDAARAAEDAGWFYTQARAFAEFLIEASGRRDVLGVIAAHVAADGDMESWLAGHGAAHALPDSLTGLELAWSNWLARRH